MVVAVLAIILTVILVIGIHEWGHACVARLLNIKIQKISIGFGPPLIQWQSRSGCEWALSLWPLGGYVQLLNSRISPVEPSKYPHCFDKKTVGDRIWVLLAGAFANLMIALFAFTLVYWIGINYKSPTIQSVQPNSIAFKAGLNKGDQIISLQNQLTPSWREVGMELVILWGRKNIKLTVKQASSGELKDLTLSLNQVQMGMKETSLLSSLGIVPNVSGKDQMIRYSSIVDALKQATHVLLHMTYFFLIVLKQLFGGVIPFSILLGPIGLFATSIASLTQGFVVFIYFIACLSLAVALINLFPVPGLDGGSIVYAIIEKIRGKPVSVAFEVLLHRLMVILSCILLVHLIMNDLQRYFIH